jgi:hypothetical protein
MLNILNIKYANDHPHTDYAVQQHLGHRLSKTNVQSIIKRIANGLVDYKLNDRLKFSMGLFVFSITDEESDFYAFREEHRIELKTKYQF